jgi:dihydroorotate dehydrogenase
VNIYRNIIRPILFQCDPERAHELAIQSGRLLSHRPFPSLISKYYTITDPRLATEVCGLHFPNPIGLAAGYDKSGEAIPFLESLGFGHIEIGSVSAAPSKGNPKPRLFRLPQDSAIVVHYGLQNHGADLIAKRLNHTHHHHPLGINIVKTNRGINASPNTEEDILTDYIHAINQLKNCADYLALNLSCPNTEMGRDFFSEKAHIKRFITALNDLDIPCPVFLKISPTGGISAIEDMLEAVDHATFISGFTFNLPPGKQVPLSTPISIWQTMPGAIAGKPVEHLINTCITELYRRMNKKRYHIIGAGGIFTAQDAYHKIQLGASLTQLLTALIYNGPSIAHRINKELIELIERDGLKSISEAVGTKNSRT